MPKHNTDWTIKNHSGRGGRPDAERERRRQEDRADDATHVNVLEIRGDMCGAQVESVGECGQTVAASPVDVV